MSENADRQQNGEFALPAKRRAEILRIVKQMGQISVTEMSSRFDVSLDTIRRDLDILADQGLVSRIHGGAVPVENLAASDAPYDLRVNTQYTAKSIIARTAAQLISDGETLLINGGSTTVAFAGCLGERTNLKIVTNSLSLPSAVPPHAVRNLYLLGGEIRHGARVAIGPVGFAGTGAINADTAVIGVGGISVDGCSTSDIAEAAMMAGMIRAARRTIIVADASKFGRLSFAQVVPLDAIAILVTDQPPPSDLAQALELARVRVIVGE
jgi:DeoR/GlpR family transcriptional regulator of sugar metabolism